MREQCDAIYAYADALDQGVPDVMGEHPRLTQLIERTAKRLSYAAKYLSNRP